MRRRGAYFYVAVGLVLAATAACGSREVTKPEAVSAKLIGGAMLGSDSTEIVAITAYVPPNSAFRLSDFTVGSSVCCVGLKIGGQSIEANRVEQFDTREKSMKVEFAFLQAPGVKEVTLSYKTVPAGSVLKVSR
jgi:hypothetical protein